MRIVFAIVVTLAVLSSVGSVAEGDSAVQAENARLKQEVAELKKTVEQLRVENDRLKKQWNDAVRGGGRAATAPSTPATKPAAQIEQDGPGLYRVTAGKNPQFTATVRAKSREDAITQGLKTVGKKAMDYDENVNLNEMKVERLGP